MDAARTLTPSDLTENQWTVLSRLIASFQSYKKTETRGRPRCNQREVFNAVLWKISHGLPWNALPKSYPSHTTCHRYFLHWYESGFLREALTSLFGDAGRELYRAALSGTRLPR
ncbi:transposase [Paraburkholderia sp. Ac-20347]|jgi:transposase|nr:transposase [Paraburkholderia sp. Ac-20347]